MIKALLLVALVACTDDAPAFEIQVQLIGAPPIAVAGKTLQVFDFASADDARATPPSVTIEGAGSFPIAFDCSFASTYDTPTMVLIRAVLVHDRTTWRLDARTHECRYSNGIAVVVDD